MSEKKYTPCGGCGAADPIQRCLGCAHPFRTIETPMTGKWVNLSENYTEDWAIMHCRFADDKYKLDTELFEEKDGCLIKKGGTGAARLSEVEYLIEDESPAEQPVDGELEHLRQWKKEAIEILAPVIEYAQGHKDAKLGGSCTEFVIDRCKELDRIKAPEQPVAPTFWDVAKAFKWVAEHKTDKGEHLMLADGWCLMSDGGVNEELTPGNVAELYCLQNGWNKEEQPVREVEAEGEFAEWAATIAFFDDEYKLWELIGEGEAINGQFRFTTKELYDLFKGRPAEWSGEKEVKP